MKKLTFYACLAVLTAISWQSVQAQNAPVAGTDAAERGSLLSNKSEPMTASLAVRTSPFDPPEDSDHSFSTDSGPKLDTGCIFRSQGPIIFNIEVKRFIGELNPDGTLKDADALIASGAISPTVKLLMPGFDVDSRASVPGVAPERDRVTVNGEVVGFLDGENNQWVLNSFELDIRKVKFAQRGANGSQPTGGVNQIRIDIDTANSIEAWCTSIDWGVGSFRAFSPVIFIHGNGSNGDFFRRQGFTGELDSRKLAYDNSINLATGSGGSAFISQNANELNGKIPGIVRSFGATTVHLIVHSKGGLDSREYLASFQRNYQNEFKIISLTTLGTPHNGSVLADLSVARFGAAQQVGTLGRVEFEGFPDYLRQMIAIEQRNGLDNGRRNLTTGFVSGFNAVNLSRLNGLGVTFNTIAGDADRNGNGRIDRNPDEFREIRDEGGLPDIGLSTYIVDSLYQILRRTRGVTVRYRDQCLTRFGPCRKIATITSIDNPTLLGNDTLVTLPSAQGVGSIQIRTSNSRTFTGGNGKNHSNIADGQVARTIIPWLFQIDRQKGGLR